MRDCWKTAAGDFAAHQEMAVVFSEARLAVLMLTRSGRDFRTDTSAKQEGEDFHSFVPWRSSI